MSAPARALLLLLGCALSTPLAAIGNLGGYRSLDPADCATYLHDYRAARAEDGTIDRDSGRFAGHAGFIRGYFSAFNAWVGNDIVDITDGVAYEELFASAARYCEQHATDNLVRALETMLSELWVARGRDRVGRPPGPPAPPPAE